MNLNLIGWLTWQENITDNKSLDAKRLKSATCQRGVTCFVFFLYGQSEVGYVCLTQKGLSVGTSCFDQNIKCLLCVDVFCR